LNFDKDELRHYVWVNRILAEEDEYNLGIKNKDSLKPMNNDWVSKHDEHKAYMEYIHTPIEFRQGDKKKPHNNDWLRFYSFPTFGHPIV
jgi:hypothetical protein